MPSKLHDSFDSKGYNPEIVAGAYAHRRMEDFVNIINAASYPHPPQQTGGKVYVHCDAYLAKCMEIIGSDDSENLPAGKKAALRAQAIESLSALVETLSADKTLNHTEQRYLEEFVFFQAITDKLLAGEDMAAIQQFIETAPIGRNEPSEPR